MTSKKVLGYLLALTLVFGEFALAQESAPMDADIAAAEANRWTSDVPTTRACRAAGARPC